MTSYNEFREWLISLGVDNQSINYSVSRIEGAWKEGYLDLQDWAYRTHDDDDWYEIDDDIVEWLIDFCENNI